MACKKNSIIAVLKILESNTDEQHPMTQTKIADWIADAKGCCDRKTVGRNIRFLQDLGYPIIKTPKGFYLSMKKFSLEEAEFIQKAILAANGKSGEEKSELALLFNQRIVSADRVRCQRFHRAASVQNDKKFREILFHSSSLFSRK